VQTDAERSGESKGETTTLGSAEKPVGLLGDRVRERRGVFLWVRDRLGHRTILAAALRGVKAGDGGGHDLVGSRQSAV
jgi:hypothetical protein